MEAQRLPLLMLPTQWILLQFWLLVALLWFWTVTQGKAAWREGLLCACLLLLWFTIIVLPDLGTQGGIERRNRNKQILLWNREHPNAKRQLEP